MRLILSFFSCLSFIILSACSASYKELSNNSFSPPTEFTKYLMEAYKTKADFEAKKMHDWNSAKLYSEKALAAVKGKKIEPEKIDYWKIPTNQISELQKAYENLMIVYNDAIISNPYNLAKAISSLDCWSEQQEEKWQTWDIKKCKEDFLNAMHKIYSSIKTKKQEKQITKEEKSDSITVVTKNNNEEILQIIYFDFDKSNLSEVSLSKIKNFVEKNKYKINKFLIVGHTDTKGSKKYNIKLSLERAKTVKKVFVNLGIISKNIKILAEGESKLLVPTADEVAHPANRRAEISPIN